MESKRVEFWDRIEWRNEKGKLHRLDGPARIWADGYEEWWVNDKIHREDGPVYVLDGIKHWALNGIKYSEEQYEIELVKLKLNRIKNL